MKENDELAFKSGECDPSNQSNFDYLEGVIVYLERKLGENNSGYNMLMKMIDVHQFVI